MTFHSDRNKMDERLWSRLPEDITERILTFLPFADLLRFRGVCKPWNAFLRVRRPLDLISDFSQPPSLLCLTTVDSPHLVIQIFNVELRKWNELSLRFLPPEIIEVSVVASNGGLLYLRARAADNSILIVCNPLTKTWTELPSVHPEASDNVSVGMLAAMSTCLDSGSTQCGSYKIIEAGHNGLMDSSTKIFDSSTRSWSTCGSIPSEVTGFESEGVIVNHCCYGVTCLPLKLLKIELESGAGTWSEFSAGLPSFSVYPHLVESFGSLAIVAGFDPYWEGEEIPEPIALKIWKLNESLMKWDEVSTLPEEMCKKYLIGNCSTFDSLKCAAHDTAIYVANYDGSIILVYDVQRQCWTQLPECPYLSNGQSCVEQLFMLKPSLQSII